MQILTLGCPSGGTNEANLEQTRGLGSEETRARSSSALTVAMRGGASISSAHLVTHSNVAPRRHTLQCTRRTAHPKESTFQLRRSEQERTEQSSLNYIFLFYTVEARAARAAASAAATAAMQRCRCRTATGRCRNCRTRKPEPEPKIGKRMRRFWRKIV